MTAHEPSEDASDRAWAAIPRPGEIVLGKYRIDGVLGRGGMGLVVAATHLQLDQPVALKFLAAAADLPGAVERFCREARASARLRSEHVVRVMDSGTLESGAAYIAMERLEGEDLATRLERGPVGVVEAVTYVLQACQALAEAHLVGIVHRDLKPANLFLTTKPDGSPCVKVLDFGISKMLAEQSLATVESNLTGTHALLGSPLYMSPEQMRAARTVDPRSDIWALGIILYELVTGRCPFQGDTMPELVAQILMEAPRALRELDPSLPEGLEKVVLRCLEKSMDRRYASVAELAAELAPLGDDDAKRAAAAVWRIGALEGESSLSRRPTSSRGSAGIPPSSVPLTIAASPALDLAPSSVGGDGDVFAGASRTPVSPPSVTVAMAPAGDTVPPDSPRESIAYRSDSFSVSRAPWLRPSRTPWVVGVLVVSVAAGVVVRIRRGANEGERARPDASGSVAASSAAPSAAPEENPWVLISPPTDREITLGFALVSSPQPGTLVVSDRKAVEAEAALAPRLRVLAPRTPYRLHAHEVTWRAFDPWLDATPGQLFDRTWLPPAEERAALPATGMSWTAADAYCRSIGGRLPTEAEWEFAARGAALALTPWGGPASDLGGVHVFAGKGARPVAVMQGTRDVVTLPSGGKLFDMLGNAREWTATEWVAGDTGEKKVFKDYVYRVVRGLPLDREPPARDAAACEATHRADACAAELPRQGLAYRSQLCAEGSCLDSHDAAGKLRTELRRAIGFRCASDAR